MMKMNMFYFIGMVSYGFLIISIFAAIIMMPAGGTAWSEELSAGKRPLYPDTALVSGGKAVCVIVYPAARPRYRELAGEIQSAINRLTGVKVKTVTDVEATEDKYPVLRREFRQTNLILLGRLGINRAVWPAYNRFKCAVDGYYPGGTGYVVQTAANVFGDGRNMIVVGGSTDDGAERGVKMFLGILEKQKASGDVERVSSQDWLTKLAKRAIKSNLTLPWILEVELGGECKNVFDRDEAKEIKRGFWVDEVSHDGRPEKRFYETAMNYYWSGRKTYLDLSRKYLDYVLQKRVKENGIAASHYSMGFFIAAYDMLDDSGLAPAETIQAVDNAILKTFKCWPMRDSEASLLKRLQGEVITTLGSHSAGSFESERALCDFVLKKLAVPMELKREATLRKESLEKTLDWQIRNLWMGYENYTDGVWKGTDMLFRYALETEQYEAFFDSGNARRAAMYVLGRAANPDGRDVGAISRWMDYKLFLGICASYYQDSGFKFVIEKMHSVYRPHYGTYVNGVHFYYPGDEVTAALPPALIGAFAEPLMPVQYNQLVNTNAEEKLAYKDMFGLLGIRSGFEVMDDSLLIKGAVVCRHEGPGRVANIIFRLASKGQYWLINSEEPGYFNHNALSITSKAASLLPEEAVRSPLARLNHCASSDTAAFISATLPDCAGADWQRDVVWLKDRFWVVFDKVTAREADEFTALANWQVGEGGLNGRRWQVVRGGWEFIIAPCTQTELIADADLTFDWLPRFKVFRERASRRLARGESFSIVNLMFVRKADSKTDYTVQSISDETIIACGPGGDGDLILVGALPPELGQTDAALVIVTADGITVFDAARLTVAGKSIHSSGEKKTAHYRLSSPEVLNYLTAQARNIQTGAGSGREPAEQPKESGGGAGRLKVRWRYEGALQPGLVAGAVFIDSSTVDFGRTIPLAEMMTASGSLPDKILVSEKENVEAAFRPFDGERQDRDIIQMLNYGNARKVEKYYQRLIGRVAQNARYLKLVSDKNWKNGDILFYSTEQPKARQRMQVKVANLDADGRPAVFMYPYVWPFARPFDSAIQNIFVLNADGTERWRKELPWRTHVARVLNWDNSGRQNIFLGLLDNNIYIHDADGKLVRQVALAGNPGTVGLWQADKSGRRKIVVPGYHHTSFFDSEGKSEGRAETIDYWNNDVLDHGADITGDGVEDTVIMSADFLTLIDGAKQDTVETVTSGTGVTQIKRPYRIKRDNEGLPGGVVGLTGNPTLAFDLLDRQAKSPHYLLAARWNFLSVYDLKQMKYALKWRPVGYLSAAGWRALGAGRYQIIAAVGDGVLRLIDLSPAMEVEAVRNWPSPGFVNKAAPLRAGAPYLFALACDTGIYLFDGQNAPVLGQAGNFVDVADFPVNGGKSIRLVAADVNGVVELLE